MRSPAEKPPVQGVIFDFGGVIHTFDPGVFFRRLGACAGRTPEEIASLIAGSGLPRRYESGEISSRKFYHGMKRIIGLRISEDEFRSAFVAIFHPVEPILRLIRGLARSYRLGLLSNTNEWHFEHHIRNVEVFPLFDAVTLSYKIGTMKPEEGIYRDLLRKIGLPPEVCVFVDDLEENVAGAKRINMQAIRYTEHKRLVSSLAELGVVAGRDGGK